MNQERLEAWCVAGLRLALGEEGPALLRRARPWLEAVLDDVDRPPVLNIVLDVGRLLVGERLPTWGTSAVHALDHALQNYAEHVVGRLIQDPRLESAVTAVLRLPVGRRRDAIATVVDTLVRRLGVPFPTLPRATLRHLLHLPEERLWVLGERALDDPEIARLLAEQLDDVATRARRTGLLLREADVFVLENLDVLRSPSQQLALEQIAHAAEAIERHLPRKIRARPRRKGTHRTRLDEEGTYPTGGYASVANYGTLANLVPSELAYTDDGAAIDLFDLRFATNELLKYTRDESVFHRARRTVVLALDEDLVAARVKPPELPWQRVVVVAGAVVAIARRLFAQVVDDDLHVELFVPSALRPEGDLMKMLLREWVELGALSFHDTDLNGELERHAELRTSQDFTLLAIGHSDTREQADHSLVATDAQLNTLEAWSDGVHALLREIL